MKLLQRGTRENFMYNGSFHEAIGSILAFAQLFGVMPLCGIKSKSPSQLHFDWKTIRFFYSLFVILSLAGNTVLVSEYENHENASKVK